MEMANQKYIVTIRKDTWFNSKLLWFADVKSTDGEFEIKNWQKAYRTKTRLLNEVRGWSDIIEKIIDHNGKEIEV
jgi:hypothetical protein